jgi:hypothetical protein
MKNKKGNAEFLFGIMVLFLIIWYIGSNLGDNSYKSCVRDCKKLKSNDYNYETTCTYLNGSGYKCLQIDYDKLNLFCWNECKLQIEE